MSLADLLIIIGLILVCIILFMPVYLVACDTNAIKCLIDGVALVVI